MTQSSNTKCPFTIVIKTFIRPWRALRVTNSIVKHYPNVPVILVDDGRPKARNVVKIHDSVRHLDLPFDSGISAGRNAGVKLVETKYSVVFDDDFIVEDANVLWDAARYLDEHSELDILGIRLLNPSLNQIISYAADFKRKGKVLYITPIDRTAAKVDDHLVCRKILNCFIAKTQSLVANPWDPDLKTQEHWEYFYRFKGNVALYLNGSITHSRLKANSRRYHRFRARGTQFMRIGLRKHGLAVVKRGDPK